MVPMDKIVMPAVALTSDGSSTSCYFNNTMFSAKLYTKMPRIYPVSNNSSSDSSSDSYQLWPYAAESNQVVSGGTGIPNCYRLGNGNLGDPVRVGTESGSQKCSCLYRNYGR